MTVLKCLLNALVTSLVFIFDDTFVFIIPLINEVRLYMASQAYEQGDQFLMMCIFRLKYH